MVKIRIPKPNQRPRATLEAEINRLKQELETEKSSNKQLRASIDVMQIGWDLDKQKLAEAVVKLDKCSVEKVEDLTLQSDEEIPTPTPDSINNRQSESGPVVCALCCKKTFPNLEQFRNHLKVVESNLICPFCAKRKCTCSLIKHFNKGCPNVDNLPVQTQLAREAQTQTTVDIPSTFPMQHLLARVSVKMVHTLDKSGVKRILPHITMEPFTSKVNVQNPNTIESNAALESGAGVSNVQRVPADSTDTNSILYKSLKKYVGEEISQIDINTSETPDLTSKKNKVQQTLERTTSAKTVDQAEGSTIKTNSKIVDKSGPGKKNNDEVAERSASDTKSKNEKNDTPVKKSNPEIIRHKHGKKSDKKIKKSASLDSIKQGKQIGKRLNQECKNSDVSSHQKIIKL